MSKIGDRKTLLNVANAWGTFPINSLDQAGAFLQQLYDATDGLVILDFLDASNWDRFESFSVDHDTGMLQINWHDFIEQDRQESRSQEREMMAMAFPASLYSMTLKFNSIERVENDNVCCFALRGYALTDKQIRKVLSSGEDFLIRKDRPFSREVLRKIDGHVEVIDYISSAIYTVLIVPKRMRISAYESKSFLYQHNLAFIDDSLGRCEGVLQDVDNFDVEAICEKANTIRKNMETLLKVECCFRDIETPQPYSQARMGDLWGLLKSFHSEGVKVLISRFIQWANELSHDTGMPIEKTKAVAIALMARMYAKLFSQEVDMECRHPSLRSREEEYIAF